jgi:PAS domain S-box-containing protein
MVVASDGAGVLLHWNTECERISGYTKEEILGIPDAVDVFFADPRYEEEVRAFAREKIGAFRDFEVTIRTKSGEDRIVSCTDISASLPVPGWARWFIALDVTESKQTERALRESEELFRNTFEHSSVGIVLANLDGRIRHVNPAFRGILGLSLEELMTRRVVDLLHHDDQPAALRDLRDLVAGATPVARRERRMVGRDGREA